ncbi:MULTISPECIES: helix-turn-helix transcriptional regulator [Roseobacteraceae]|nr:MULTISPECIES: AraC family transcriptional regulator [Roseobacteraceae]
MFRTATIIDSQAKAWESPMFGRANKFNFISERVKLTEESVVLPKSGFRLTRLFSTGHELEISVHDSCALLLPINGRVGYRMTDLEVWASAGESALLSRPCDRWSVVDPMNDEFCQCLIFQFPETLNLYSEVDGIYSNQVLNKIPYGIEMEFRDPYNFRLARYLQLVADELSPSSPVSPSDRYLEGMEVLLEECLKDTIFRAGKAEEPQLSDLRDVKRARLAEALIHERFHEPLRVADMARELGMSVRSLQTAFSSVFQMSPRQMIAKVRLGYAYSRLSQPHSDDQVSTIALECGITHLSRFASEYFRRFGEYPKETLSRARLTSISRPKP